jgi:membrane fusion protein, multidrug efflux system
MDMPVSKTLSAEPGQTRPKPSRGKLILRLLIMAVLMGGVLFGLYWFNGYRDKMIAQYFAGNVPPPVPVAAVKVGTESMPRFLDGIGTIQAVHQVTVSPEVNGRVVKIMFESGSSVKSGDPLLQLNDEPEQADLANFQAQVRLAQITLERSRKLATQQYTAQQTVDQNQSDLAVAQAGIARTQAVISQKLVRAPFAGVLGVRQVDVGQYLSAGTPIVTLTDLDTLNVNFTLPEQARSELSVGQVVEIRVDAYKDQVFKAELTTIEPQIDPNMRSIKVQATMNNADHKLLPGMFAAARVVLASQPDVVTLPETAVDYSAYGESVFILQPKDPPAKDAGGQEIYKAVQAFVKTGSRHDGKVAVLEGVKPGDLVVSAGQVKLQNGMDAVVSNDDSLAKPATMPVN